MGQGQGPMGQGHGPVGQRQGPAGQGPAGQGPTGQRQGQGQGQGFPPPRSELPSAPSAPRPEPMGPSRGPAGASGGLQPTPGPGSPLLSGPDSSSGQDPSFWFPAGSRGDDGAAAPAGGGYPAPEPAGPVEAPARGTAGAQEETVSRVALSLPLPPVAGIPQPRVGVQGSATGEDAYERTTTEQRVGAGDLDLDLVLRGVSQIGASDLHLTASSPPLVRVNGELAPVPDSEPLTAAMIQRVIYSVITQKQRERFEENLELDFSYSVPGASRFRVNLYRQREAIGAAFRRIPFEIKDLDELGIPNTVSAFASLPRGMVLVTGPTGSGKSTTLASLIDLANRNRRDHIMTVEDPIEFLHSHKSCMVNQREVGEDTHSFANALKHVLRQDPDIILVGEMRDLETISVALTAAETGHLVFATLHTQDAAQTVDRVIDVFPPHQQQQVRVQLSGALQGVVCQTLCRTADGRGRTVAAEVMVATPAIRNLIREGKTHQIYSSMQAGGKFGMQTLDQHLAELVRTRRITVEQGMEKCHHIEDFSRLIGRG
jgi:twitching motility protein PilT